MNAKIILGLVLLGTAILFITQNLAVMELSFLFWTISTSSALIMALMLAIGLFLGLLLHGSFKRKQSGAHDSQ